MVNDPIVTGKGVSLFLPVTPPIVKALYDLHRGGRRNMFNVHPPTTETVEQWAQTFRRGFHTDFAVVDNSSGRLLGYMWSYEYIAQHGNCLIGAMFRPDLIHDDDGLRLNIAHLEGLALFIDVLFDEWPLDIIGIECSDSTLKQFESFLPRLFTMCEARKGWLRHGGSRESMTFGSMTREAWNDSRFSYNKFWRVGT